jgi:hypothetical protein
LKIKICETFGNKYASTALGAVGAFALFMGLQAVTLNIIGVIAGLIFGLIVGITSWLISKFKNKEKILSEKLESCKSDFNDKYLIIRSKFIRLYKESLKETQKLFTELLSLACADLSKIEKEKWKNLKIKYQEIKINILLLSNK